MITVNKKRATTLLAMSFSTVAALTLTGCKTSESIGDETPFEHRDNVFAAVDNWYVDDVWSNSAAADGGEAVARHSTGVWLNSIADIEEVQPGEVPLIPALEDGASPTSGIALREHLTAAEEQGSALLQLVLHNLPGRDCASVLSYGELPGNEYGFTTYQEHYIDRIAGILADYPHIPVVAVVEPNSLLNQVKYQFDEPCMEVNNEKSYGYTNGVRYAINVLSQLDNVHLYLDVGASNNFGWDDDMRLTTLFMHGVLTGFDGLREHAHAIGEDIESSVGGTGRYDDIGARFVEPPTSASGNTHAPGYGAIDGFISNVSEWVPLEEPYLGDPRQPEGANPLRSAYFYDWNPRVDEWTYTRDWLEAIQTLNAEDTTHLGMLIDTSRNGWGQGHKRIADKDVAVQDPELVDDYRIDRRDHRQNWCNQFGGLGARPQPSPNDKPWMDAYVWVTPPGRSDGVADWNSVWNPNSPSRKHEPSCDPEELSTPGRASETTADMYLGTSAMPDAPWIGEWFSGGFEVLTENAWPPLCEGYQDQCE